MDDQLSAFFDALFEPADLIEIRLLPPLKTKSNQLYWYSGQILNDFDFIEDRNRRQDVYFGVNPRQQHNGTEESITICRSLVADFDHTTVEAAMETISAKGMPTPTAVVSSGHGAHAYWRLEEEVDKQQWRALQRGIIGLLGCDEKVKDPPRIMRLPGTKHVAKHVKGTDFTYCEIEYVESLRYSAEEIAAVLPAQVPDEVGGGEPLPEGSKAALPHWANAFLINGGQEGNRNQTAFDVACVMAANGWPIDEAKRMIVSAAERCAPPMPQGEALVAVKSAYSKPRTPPAEDLSHLPAMTAWQVAAPKPEAPEPKFDEAEVEDEELIRVGSPNASISSRPYFTNVLQSKDREGETIYHAKHVDDITAAMQETTGKWPRRAGGILFAPGDTTPAGELPGPSAVRYLTKVDELYAWLHQRTSLNWQPNKQCIDQTSGLPRTAVSKSEYFEHVRQTVNPAYESCELLPHHPPVDNVWYAPCVLRRAPRSLLEGFVDQLNWQSDLDRDLMLAACLTMFWGGPCGARPAFIITSEHGAGAGKSVTAQMIAQIGGGEIEIGGEEGTDAFIKRLLSDAGMAKRAIMLDNVKKKVDSQGIEAMITAAEIGGHRMYHGHATRPNRMLWLITANNPRMSHDLAQRSYNIQIGVQRTSSDWKSRMGRWVDENREGLVAACMGVLEAPPVCEITHRDRWADWQEGVLSRVPLGNDIAAAMVERRAEIDSDQSDAGDIALVVRGLARYYGHIADRCRIFFTRRALADAYNVYQGEDGASRRVTVGFIGNRIGNGALKRLKETKLRGERGYAWTGPEAGGSDAYDLTVSDMPSGLTVDDLTVSDEPNG